MTGMTSMTAQHRYVAIGCATMAALLLALIVPDFHRSAIALSHPDPVGPTAYSKSASVISPSVTCSKTSTSPPPSANPVPADTPASTMSWPSLNPAPMTQPSMTVRVMLTARTVLLVLPKRLGKPDPDRPYWLADDKLIADDDIARVLYLVDKNATLARTASLATLTGDPVLSGSPAIDKPQLIHSKILRPLLSTPDGILTGEKRAPGASTCSPIPLSFPTMP